MKKKLDEIQAREMVIKERLARYLAKIRNNKEKNSFWLDLKLSPAKMGRFENKREKPSLLKLIEVCEKTGLSANWLLLGHGPETTEEIPETITHGELIERTCNELLRLLQKEKKRPFQELYAVLKRYRNEARAARKTAVSNVSENHGGNDQGHSATKAATTLAGNKTDSCSGGKIS